MGSIEKATTACTDNAWQEEAARFLLSCGFRPGNTIGQVEYMANPHRAGRTGRTFGSIWRAMRSLVESEAESAAGDAQNAARGEPLQ